MEPLLSLYVTVGGVAGGSGGPENMKTSLKGSLSSKAHYWKDHWWINSVKYA